MIDYEIASEEERPTGCFRGMYNRFLPELAAGKTIFIPCERERQKAIRNGVAYAAKRHGLPRLAIRNGVRRGRDGLFIWVRDDAR